jgi:hypothetical protein
MSFDSKAVLTLFDRVASHAAGLGLFDSPVLTNEPKNPPGNGVWCAIFTDAIDPLPRLSGLNESAGRVTFRVRVGSNALAEPQDSIDPNVMIAATTLMGEYSGHFTLDGNVIAVDLLGMFGRSLAARGAFITIQQRVYRVLEVILPILIDPMFTQGA